MSDTDYVKKVVPKTDEWIEELENSNQELRQFLNIEIGGHQSTMEYVKELQSALLKADETLIVYEDLSMSVNNINHALPQHKLAKETRAAISEVVKGIKK